LVLGDSQIRESGAEAVGDRVGFITRSDTDIKKKMGEEPKPRKLFH